MLKQEQIKFLAEAAQIKAVIYNNVVISVKPEFGRENKIVKYPVEEFQKRIGLEPMRFQWMLGETNLLAGGSVLNWIWQENKNQDTDFFFKSEDNVEVFTAFLKSIGLTKTKTTNYAKTYFDDNSGAIIQVVSPTQNIGFTGYGTPEQIISKFDIDVCKFAVDNNYIYFSVGAICDLVSMTLEITENIKSKDIYRIFKYLKKGFYPGATVREATKFQPQWISIQR